MYWWSVCDSGDPEWDAIMVLAESEVDALEEGARRWSIEADPSKAFLVATKVDIPVTADQAQRHKYRLRDNDGY